MHTNDLEAFKWMLKRCGKTFGKKVDDELVEAYWAALKDEPLSTVERLAGHQMRYGKFFPKPSELRPKADKAPEDRSEADKKFRTCEDACIRSLEEMRQHDYAGWLKRVGPNSSAGRINEQFGPSRVYYDLPARCWKRA